MILWLRNIVAYLISAIAATALTKWIASTVVSELILPNLVGIVVALLAINVQTTAVIAVKLREISEKRQCDFALSVNQFRIAIFEQVALVGLAIGASTLAKSNLVEAAAKTLPLPLEAGIFFILFASLHVFLDTTIGLLIALFPEQNPEP